MNPKEILAVVTEIAEQHLAWKGALSPEMDLIEDLGLDSLQLLTLAVEVENRFLVCLDEADEARIRTVGDLVAAVQRKLKRQGSK